MFIVSQIGNRPKYFSLWLSSLFVFSFLSIPLHADTNASVAAGENHSLLLRTDGSLWSMGKNDRGQRGDGSKLERGLVGWWKFDGDATDSSGNGNDGTVNGATLTTDRHGQANGAYSFDGVDDYILVSHHSSLDFNKNDPHTISVWVYALNSSHSGSVMEKWVSAGGAPYPYVIRFGNDTIVHGRYDGVSSLSLSFSSALLSSEFVQVTFSSDGSTRSLFSNGVLVDSAPVSGSLGTISNSADLYIGKRGGNSVRNFNGLIDDLRIYNRALSSTEVSALYTLESQPFSLQPARVVDENVTAIASGSETSYFIKNDGSLWGMGRNDRGQLGNAQGLDQGLVGWWKFDGDATDSSSNGNDGTVNGATLTTDRHGQANGAYSFDGNGDYILVPHDSSIDFNKEDSYTIGFWIYAPNAGQLSSVMEKWVDSPTSPYPYVFRMENGGFYFQPYDGSTGVPLRFSPSSSFAAEFMHFVFSSDGTNMNLYSNGADVDSGTFPNSFGTISNSIDLYIGRRGGTSSFDFNGSIDDVRIYDRTLSASEVAALYNLESQPEDRSAPIQIVDSNVTAVSSRGSHALFQKTDGSLWAMGANDYGQLGDGTTTDRHTPRQVFAWEEKASNSLARAAYDGVEAMDGKLYFAGGGNVGNVHATFESFDPSTGSWQTLPSLNTARVGASMAVYNGKFHVFGGASASGPGNKLGSVEIYNSVTNSWSAGPNLPVACNYSVAMTYGNKILLFGGWDQAENNMDQVLEFDPSLNTWSAKTSMPVGRTGMKAVVCEGKIWLMGGISGVGINYSNRVDVYDPIADTWSQMPGLTVARHWALAWTLNGQVYIGGGRPDASTYLTTIESYDSSSNQWRIIGKLPARAYQSDSALINGKLYLTGGYDGSAHSNKLFMTDLNPVTAFSAGGDHSRFVQEDGSLWAMGRNHVGQLGDGTTTDRPSPVKIETVNWEEKASLSISIRLYRGMEVLNNEIYLAGGQKTGGVDLTTALRYDRGLDQWITLANMSQARRGQATATLDGKLFILGGIVGSPGAPLYSVEIYDPDLDSWSAGPTLPSTIHSSAASSVNDSIFLLGGSDGSQNLNTTWELNATGGSWVARASMLTARSGHATVVKDGKIWAIGGYGLNAVESYDPQTDSWTARPSLTRNRNWPSAWIFEERIYVAGGNDGTAHLNSIEVFNPSTNQWEIVGQLPEPKFTADAVAIQGKVYLAGGESVAGVYSNKLHVADFSPVTGVASGQSHGYYLKGSGDLWAMGSNADGQLGDGTTTNRNSPVQVLNGNNVSQVSAGSREGFFTKSDGTTWAIGRNEFGQLGNTDTADQSTPAMVFGWEEKASVSVARFVSNGLVTLGNAIYCVGGYSSSTVYKLLEKYDPQTGQWENLRSMTQSREGLASAVLDGKIYALGGVGFADSEIYDPVADSWSAGADLPEVIHRACAVTYNNRLFLMGGQRADDSYLNQVLEFNSTSNQWVIRSPMPNVRSGHKLIVFQNAVWAIGGSPSGSFAKVDRYVPETDTWSSMPDMITGRSWGVTWVLGDRLYAGGGSNGSYLKSVESFDPVSNQWQEVGEFPQSSYASGFAQLGNKLFLVGGGVSTGVYSDKLYVSDLSPLQAVASNGNSNPNTILIKQDGTFWGMGRNDSGQIGDGSLSNRSYPVPIISSYTLVVNGAPEGNATGGGEWSIGSPVTLTATPNPGYLFAGWVGDLNSTDANVTLSPTGNLEVNATFTQDLQDNDDDNLTNFYEIVTLGTNADNNDTDGDGLPDGVEDGVLGIDPLLDNALIVALFAQREIDAHAVGLAEGNASGQQYVYDYRSTFSLYNEAEVNASAQQRESNGSLTGEPLGRLYVQANPTEFNLYTEADLNASMDSERVRGMADGNLSGTGQVVANPTAYGLYSEAEVNASLLSEYNRGVREGNASGWSYLQTNRLAYSLFNSSDLNTSGDLAYARGVGEGNSSGIAYAAAHPSEFSLHTSADLNQSGVLFRANGVRDGNASGQSHVLNNLASFELVTESELNATRLVEREHGRAEGNQSGMSYVLANPQEFNLFESIDLNRSGDAEYLRGQTDGKSLGRSHALANPNLYQLFTQSDLNVTATLAHLSGRGEGNASGIAYLQTHARDYGLYTRTDRDSLIAQARSEGLAEGNASGIAQVQADPAQYSLLSLSEAEQVRQSTRQLALSDGFQRGVDWVKNNPRLYNLYDSAQRSVLVEQAKSEGHSEGLQAGEAYVLARPGEFGWLDDPTRSALEESARLAAYYQGLENGKVKVMNDPAGYSLFTTTQRDTLVQSTYASSFMEGNTTGIATVFAQRQMHQLSADYERDERIRLSGELGYSVGNAAGRAEALATAQADLSAQGLHLVEFLEQTALTPYTYNWYYQPGIGWLWTDQSTFPHLYRSTGEGTQSRWLYYDANRTELPFYDYQQKMWKEIVP